MQLMCEPKLQEQETLLMNIPHSETNINDKYHFKEIDTYMEEFWKTHIAVPPHEDDPPCIVARIVEKIKEK